MKNARTLAGRRRYQIKSHSVILTQKDLNNQSSDIVIASIQAIGGVR